MALFMKFPTHVLESHQYIKTDTCLAADQLQIHGLRVRSPSLTFTEIDHEIISMAFLLPSGDSRRVVVSYKRRYVHEALVNRLVKLAQAKSVVR